VLKHGTGALNIDATRIGTDGGTASTGEPNRKNQVYGDGMGGLPSVPLLAGRWPANVLLDEDAARMLDEQSGESRSVVRVCEDHDESRSTWALGRTGITPRGVADSGGASRFFLNVKADKEDECSPNDPARSAESDSCLSSARGASALSLAQTAFDLTEGPGIVGPASIGSSAPSTQPPSRASHAERPDDTGTIPTTPNSCGSSGSARPVTDAPINQDGAARAAADSDPVSGTRFWYTSKASRADREGSTHPTMKPTDLMRWLCRLVTPPGGLILDPFAGSGSTGVAAVAEGFRFIGIEQDAEYVAIAKRRIANVAPLFGEVAL
jgi:hypothetical protein